MTKCPKCGEKLSISMIEEDEYCRNKKCKGWYCFYCDKWHPYKTFCGVGLSGLTMNSQEKYDEWCKEHREDIFKMLKDSGYYNHWHNVDKYYLKDEEEDDDDYFMITLRRSLRNWRMNND